MMLFTSIYFYFNHVKSEIESVTVYKKTKQEAPVLTTKLCNFSTKEDQDKWFEFFSAQPIFKTKCVANFK